MYEIRVKSGFSAAHKLRGYKGKCEDLHGHNWKVEVFIENEDLDNIGMVVDFKKIKMALNVILKKLDHKYLNELPYFSAVGGSASLARKDKLSGRAGGKKTNPTSENIAKYIFEKLEVKSKNLKLKKVTVWESDTSAASYSEKD